MVTGRRRSSLPAARSSQSAVPEMPAAVNPIDPEGLLRGPGGARVIWLGEALNGPLKGFGHRFWQLVKRDASVAHAALGNGIAAIDYTDRYLLTPLSLALLRELIGAMPGARGAAIAIALAPGDPFEELATNPNVPPEVRENLRKQFGLDDPVAVRYVRWAGSMAKALRSASQ